MAAKNGHRTRPHLLSRLLLVKYIFTIILVLGTSTCVILINYQHSTGADRIWDCDASPSNQSNFRPVGYGNDTHVFSAYHDTIDGRGYIRVIGLSLTDQTAVPPMYCLIGDKLNNKCYKANSSVSVIPETHGYRYSGAFILCPVPPGGHPASVTIIADNVPTDFPGDRADPRGITISAELPAEEFRIVACVPPLHRRYDKVSQLIEFVEVQRMLGVDLIVVYNHSVSARVGKVLDSMSHHGVVHVIPWELPFDAYLGGGYTNIHYFGQLAAVNDCLYRYRSRTQYIINVDMDEYIVPSLEGNLWLWVNKQLTLNPAASAFILKSYLLYSYLPDHKDYFPTQEAAKKYQLVTLLKTNRTEETLPFRIRPKYIYDPKRVVSAGIHNIWGHRRNFKSQYIPSDDCAVYHYRNAKVTPNPNGSVTDTYFHSFQYDIVQRIESRWRTIRREMNLTFSDLNH